MSNISRRKFLKGAGVAALAVAAAGVLAGCSGNDVPSIPDVTAKNVTVKFVDRKGKDGRYYRCQGDVKLTETKMNSNDVAGTRGLCGRYCWRPVHRLGQPDCHLHG